MQFLFSTDDCPQTHIRSHNFGVVDNCICFGINTNTNNNVSLEVQSRVTPAIFILIYMYMYEFKDQTGVSVVFHTFLSQHQVLRFLVLLYAV